MFDFLKITESDNPAVIILLLIAVIALIVSMIYIAICVHQIEKNKKKAEKQLREKQTNEKQK